MAKQKSSQQHPNRRTGLSPLEKINRGLEALQQRITQVEDLRQDGFPYRDALRTRVELQIRETIRQVFGERSSEFQRYKNHRLEIASEADRTQTLLILQNLVLTLEDQRREMTGMSSSRSQSSLTNKTPLAATSATSAGPPLMPEAAGPVQGAAPAPSRVFPTAPPAVTQPRTAASPVAPSPYPPSAGHIPSSAQAFEPGLEPLTTTLDRLRKIGERFHLVARQLRLRGEYRATVEVEDQHDVQDLFDALLRLEFEDITREQWVPSYVDSISQTTFFLREGQVAIVVKKTRPGRGPREIAYELAIDAQRYLTFPACTALFCFIYDPEGRIGDPHGLEAELSSRKGTFQVELVIAPK